MAVWGVVALPFSARHPTACAPYLRLLRSFPCSNRRLENGWGIERLISCSMPD